MKIRNGFVSNSSSSSFCVIGVEDKWASALLLAELHLTPVVRPNHGDDCACSKCRAFEAIKNGSTPEGLEFSYGQFNPPRGVKLLLNYYGAHSYVEAAGFQAEPILQDSTLADARVAFQLTVKTKFGLDIPISDIKLCYGEAGEG